MPNEYDISRAFKRIENDLIDSMMRNMKRHQVEEAELGKEWEQWQAIQLAELEEYRKNNMARFSGDFSDIQEKIDDMFYATYNDAQSAEEHRLMDRIKKGDFRPTEDKGGFFRLNEPKLEALIMATQADFARAEYAMLRRANDQYRQIIFDSMTYANITNDYAKAVDMATKDFLRAGINSVVYKNGARHNVADYASMALRTGNKRAYLMGEGNAHDRYGLHTVRVNKRTHACPKCVGFLGRLLIDDVYGGGTRAEATAKGIPTLSDAMQAGFLHPNCKDIYSAYIEGVSQPAKPWTVDEIEDITDAYNLEQEIKHAQDTVDTYNRMAKYSLDPSNVSKYEARAREWQARLDALKAKLDALNGAEVTPTYHEGIRELLTADMQVEVGGIVKIDPANIVLTEANPINGAKFTDIELKKKITIPWNTLSSEAQDIVYWNIPQRYKKSFLIQPNDLTWVSHPKVSDLPARSRDRIKSALDNGYELFGQTYISKYNRSIECFIFKKDDELYFALWGTDSRATVDDSIIKAIKDRQKVVSKDLWDEGVRFRDLTERQGDEWVNAMQKFHTAMDADRPVTLVSRAEYDKIKGEELYRGIAPVSHLRGDISMTKTPMQCAEQLMTGGVGDCFPSRGVYGDCIAYLSNSKKVAFDYATGYRRSGAGGAIARMKIKDDARVITYEDAKNLFNAIADKMGDSNEPYFSRKQRRLTNDVEVGKAMQMLGYDVIYEPRGDGMPVHFYMVLNRDAVVSIKDEWLEAEITEAILRRGHI